MQNVLCCTKTQLDKHCLARVIARARERARAGTRGRRVARGAVMMGAERASRKEGRMPPVGAQLCDLFCFPAESLALQSHYKHQRRYAEISDVAERFQSKLSLLDDISGPALFR